MRGFSFPILKCAFVGLAIIAIRSCEALSIDGIRELVSGAAEAIFISRQVMLEMSCEEIERRTEGFRESSERSCREFEIEG